MGNRVTYEIIDLLLTACHMKCLCNLFVLLRFMSKLQDP